MNCRESQMTTKDGVKLFRRIWDPEDKQIRAVICLVHGLGEHCGRYRHVAEGFSQVGFVLAAFDLRGHGESTGKRGDAPSYDSYMEDISLVLAKTAKEYPGLPIFLYGHSLGGNLVLNYVLRNKPSLNGVLVTGPWLRLEVEPPRFLLILARIACLIWPSLTISNRINPEHLSKSNEIGQAYLQDPLVHNKISLRNFFAFGQAGKWAQENAGSFSPPLLLMHGAEDTITSPRASQEFAEKAKGVCTCKLWPEARHEVHNEINRHEVVKFMVDWIKDRA